MVRGIYEYRNFIWQRAVADLRHRYAGTGLGVVWNVVHPLTMIAIYSLIFSTLMPVTARIANASEHFAYVLYLCSGFLPWLAFSECITRGANAFLENASYLKKLPMPEQVFVAQTAASATLGLVISFSLLLIVALCLGQRPSWQWLLLPIPLICMQSLGFGLGLLCGTLNVFFRDIGQVLQVVLQIVLWTAPVIWVEQSLSPRLAAVLHWHPLYPMLEAIRDLFFSTHLPAPAMWAWMFAWPALCLVLAWSVFRQLQPEIRDVV